MPQLSIETYITQYVWLVVILGFFYYYVATKIVPTIGIIKKTRARIATEAQPIHENLELLAQPKNIELGLVNTTKKTQDSKLQEIFENMNREWTKK